MTRCKESREDCEIRFEPVIPQIISVRVNAICTLSCRFRDVSADFYSSARSIKYARAPNNNR